MTNYLFILCSIHAKNSLFYHVAFGAFNNRKALWKLIRLICSLNEKKCLYFVVFKITFSLNRLRLRIVEKKNLQIHICLEFSPPLSQQYFYRFLSSIRVSIQRVADEMASMKRLVFSPLKRKTMLPYHRIRRLFLFSLHHSLLTVVATIPSDEKSLYTNSDALESFQAKRVRVYSEFRAECHPSSNLEWFGNFFF